VNGFLRKAELELILDVIFEFENAFAFMHAERGTFNMKYYPEYTMRTVPHILWQIKPIRLPKSREAEIMEMLEDQRQAGKYELSSLSYRSAIFTIEKKDGKLRLVHDLQPSTVLLMQVYPHHSMTVSMFHVGIPVGHSWGSPYMRCIIHGFIILGNCE